jgi:hypothetical protein
MNGKAWESAGRGARWLQALLEADGSMRGGTDLRAYYKTPCAFICNGYIREADLMLDYIEKRFLQTSSGDLDGDGVPWFSIYRTYSHSWICCAAMMRGRFELARQLRSFIETFHNPKSGGFFAGDARAVEEVMTTSMAGLACLWSGNRELGLAAGNWLRTLWEKQPDVHRGLYTSWQGGSLVTAYSEEDAAGCLVDPNKTRQWYFQYGISAALLSSLAGATGEAHWLELARKYLRASHHAGADRYQTPQSGKIGWGAAWTYRLTRDPMDRELAETVADGLCALQNDDGSWLASGVYGGESAAADSVTIDVTAEFATLQSYMGLVAGV